jgi:hypothetical protein
MLDIGTGTAGLRRLIFPSVTWNQQLRPIRLQSDLEGSICLSDQALYTLARGPPFPSPLQDTRLDMATVCSRVELLFQIACMKPPGCAMSPDTLFSWSPPRQETIKLEISLFTLSLSTARSPFNTSPSPHICAVTGSYIHDAPLECDEYAAGKLSRS